MMRLISLSLLFLLGTVSAGADEIDDLIARAYGGRGDSDFAMRAALADRAVAIAPTDPRAYRFRAAVNESANHHDKAILDYAQLIRLNPDDAEAFQARGSAHFRLNHITESLADFDRYLELRPHEKPHHWQRGIALYYAGRFADGARQFEIHQSVNPDDVENAAWHFLCVARTEGIEAAARKLIPIRRDGRVPMMQIHLLFAGNATGQEVLAAARADAGADRHVLHQRLFYAHLYLALHHEAHGRTDRVKEHIALAAGEYYMGDYMSAVARVHLARLETKPPT